MISRRHFLTGFSATTLAPMINLGRFQAFAATPIEFSALTLELLASCTSVDMLGLLTLNYRRFESWAKHPEQFTDADFARVRASGISVFHPAVGFDRGNIFSESLEDITDWNAFLSAQAHRFARIETAQQLQAVKASGRIGIIIGQQNSSHFRVAADVDRFYQLGQRVSQLTYDDNRLGGGSSSGKNLGLTPFGAEIVERMNRAGMAIDISHCSDRTTLDAIAASRKPVLVTHSNCRALVPASARCKTDEAIRKLAANGGVFGVTMIRFFVRPRGPATIEDMLDHVDHVARLVGVEHVGIGSDVDLAGHDPRLKADLEGIRYPKKFFEITQGLVRRNYSPDQIRMILGGNFERVLGQIWAA